MASPDSTPAMNAADRVDAFVRRFGFWQRAATLAALGLAEALVLFAAVWIVRELVPPWERTAAWISVVLWCSVVGWGWIRSRASIAAVDRSLGLRDALRTWVGHPAVGPMRDWLAHAIASRLTSSGRATLWRPVRRRLRPLRVLVPIAVALLVLRTLAPDGQRESSLPLPIPSPVVGSAERPPAPDPDADAADDRGDDDGPAEHDREDSEQAGREPDTGGTDPEREPPTLDPEPSPLIERGVEDDFAIPSFVGDGPASRSEAHVAQAAEETDVRGGRSGELEPAPSADVPPAEFERAVERALAGRHVEPDERELVRRYFRLLVEWRR